MLIPDTRSQVGAVVLSVRLDAGRFVSLTLAFGKSVKEDSHEPQQQRLSEPPNLVSAKPATDNVIDDGYRVA
jgi:hypothetical protein